MAKNIFISPFGDDSFSGETMATALRTLAMAMSFAEPGDSIVAAEGEYPEVVVFSDLTGNVVINGDLLQGDFIVIKPYLANAEVIFGTDPEADILIGSNFSGVHFKDVKFKGNCLLTNSTKLKIENTTFTGYQALGLEQSSDINLSNTGLYSTTVNGNELALDCRACSRVKLHKCVVNGDVHGEGITSITDSTITGNVIRALDGALIESSKLLLGTVAFPDSNRMRLHKTLVKASYLWNTPQAVIDIDKCTLVTQSFAQYAFAGGDGTLEDPFLIKTAEQLNNVKLTDGAGGYLFLDKYFKLIDDIDMSPVALQEEEWYDAVHGWEPIGRYVPSDPADVDSVPLEAYAFRGYFDGNGHTIQGLSINRETENYIGLFGYIFADELEDPRIWDLTLEAADIKGNKYVAALAGRVDGEVRGIEVKSSVVYAATSHVAGVISRLQGTGSLCRVSGATIVNTPGNIAGVIVAELNGELLRSVSEASVAVEGAQNVAGLVAIAEENSLIQDCLSYAQVEGHTKVAGLVSYMGANSLLRFSLAVNSILVGVVEVGGMVAEADPTSTAEASYWDIDVYNVTVSALGEGRTTSVLQDTGSYGTGWTSSGNWIVSSGAYPVPVVPIVSSDDSAVLFDGPFISLAGTTEGVRNSILWPLAGMFVWPERLGFDIKYCSLKNFESDPALLETNIINCMVGVNPLFLNIVADDYRLSDESPCIDAADPMKAVEEGGGVRADIGYWEYEKSGIVSGGSLERDAFGSFYNTIYAIQEYDPIIHDVLNLVNRQLHTNTMYLKTRISSLLEGLTSFETDMTTRIEALEVTDSNQNTINSQLSSGISSVYSLLLMTRTNYLDKTSEDAQELSASVLNLANIGLSVSASQDTVNFETEKDIELTRGLRVPAPEEDTHAVNLEYFLNGSELAVELERKIYVSGATGNDANSGRDATAPVATFEAAVNRCTRLRPNRIIFMEQGNYTVATPVQYLNLVLEGNGSTLLMDTTGFTGCDLVLSDLKINAGSVITFRRCSVTIDISPVEFSCSHTGTFIKMIDSTLNYENVPDSMFGVTRIIKGTLNHTGILIHLICSRLNLRDVNLTASEVGIKAEAGSTGYVNYVGSDFGDGVTTILDADTSCNIGIEN